MEEETTFGQLHTGRQSQEPGFGSGWKEQKKSSGFVDGNGESLLLYGDVNVV